MRAEIIDYLKPCMTDAYLHIDARMADYIRTHPCTSLGRLMSSEKSACHTHGVCSGGKLP
eukprot:COSAG05_NODE_711_length_7822_cov_11.919720_14_plen_60_part_00